MQGTCRAVAALALSLGVAMCFAGPGAAAEASETVALRVIPNSRLTTPNAAAYDVVIQNPQGAVDFYYFECSTRRIKDAVSARSESGRFTITLADSGHYTCSAYVYDTNGHCWEADRYALDVVVDSAATPAPPYFVMVPHAGLTSLGAAAYDVTITADPSAEVDAYNFLCFNDGYEVYGDGTAHFTVTMRKSGTYMCQATVEYDDSTTGSSSSDPYMLDVRLAR